MPRKVEHRGSFTAVDDSGAEHIIHLYVDVISTGSSDDPHSTKDGLKQLKTAYGQNVNRLAKGEYQIVSTGAKLRSDDPDAP